MSPLHLRGVFHTVHQRGIGLKRRVPTLSGQGWRGGGAKPQGSVDPDPWCLSLPRISWPGDFLVLDAISRLDGVELS